MMKLWSRLGFLVLAISSVSYQQNEMTDPPGSGKEGTTLLTNPPPLPNETQDEATVATSPSASPQNHATANATDLQSAVFTSEDEETTAATNDSVNTATTVGVNGSTATRKRASVSPTPASVSPTPASVSPTPASVSPTPATSSSSAPGTIAGAGHSSWGYVVLVFIIVVIIILCVILYYLRRASGTYSFDLQRHVASNHHSEPIGTFEPVYLDDLDRPASKDQVTSDDFSPAPVSNGTALQSGEQGSNGERDTNGLETLPTSNTSPSLGDDPADEKTPSPLSSTNMFFDAIGEEQQQQNENNNNPSVCSRDPFVEINLDEPAWCDRLLFSPEAPSSVLPFSPFSFSSSSSSTSSEHLQ